MTERRLYAEIVDQIVSWIDEGKFPPGSRLPGERELASTFGVSRVTIREAQIALQAQGRIEVKSGSGAHVLAPAQKRDLPEANAYELTQARSLFEGEAAALAAMMITEAELAELDSYLAAMAPGVTQSDRTRDNADQAFHFCIAKASGNSVIIDMVERLWRIRTEVAPIREAYASICGSTPQVRWQEHADIVAALRAKDADRARTAMRHHFACVLEALLLSEEQNEIDRARQQIEETRRRFQSVPVDLN
ncbi:MAG: FadR/GntR family transcriptional regulator [Pseudomonadota bacterium]